MSYQVHNTRVLENHPAFTQWVTALNTGLVCGGATALQLYVVLDKDSTSGWPSPSPR